MASSDDNGEGRDLLWRKPHSRFFLATKILSQKLIIFYTYIDKDILHAWLLALSSAPSALRVIVRCLTPVSTRPPRPTDG